MTSLATRLLNLPPGTDPIVADEVLYAIQRYLNLAPAPTVREGLPIDYRKAIRPKRKVTPALRRRILKLRYTSLLSVRAISTRLGIGETPVRKVIAGGKRIAPESTTNARRGRGR